MKLQHNALNIPISHCRNSDGMQSSPFKLMDVEACDSKTKILLTMLTKVHKFIILYKVYSVNFRKAYIRIKN